MSATRIASRYAKPLLELALERNILDQVKQDMLSFTQLCKENREFAAMLRSPIIKHFKKAEILTSIFKGKVSDITLTTFTLITRKNRETVLPEIAEEFLRMYNVNQGFQEAIVTTSFPLDNELKAAFEKVIHELSGKKPLLKEVVKPGIIGGFILMMGDRQIDESVSGKLRELKLRFQKENK
ncbi:MAG: ATP synthase F1 subunit delta [Cyclobacteriaceae bacterium]|nr:ATP synthase F1 subunit delta [Cyclobacteriaceae bacterium]